MKKAKVIIALVLAVALFAGGAYTGYKAHDFSLMKDKTEYNTIVIKEELVELADLTTQELSITDVETFSTNKELKGHKLPLTSKKIVVCYDAYVKAATDLSQAEVDIAKNDEGKAVINVTVKPCTISDLYIDENSWQYLDSKSGIFNKLKIEDDKALRDLVIKKMEDKAKEKDILGTGNEQAKIVVSQFLTQAYPDAEINVEVK